LRARGSSSGARQGYYVLYTLADERITTLSDAVLAFLGRAT